MEWINFLLNFLEVALMITIIAKPKRRAGIKRRTSNQALFRKRSGGGVHGTDCA